MFIVSRSAESCNAACTTLNALPNLRQGAKAVPLPADCATVAGTKELARKVSERTPHIDILILNAGAMVSGSIDKLTEEDYDMNMDLNLKSVYFGVQSFLPLLEARSSDADPSRILVTSSVGGLRVTGTGPDASIPYGVSKAGVVHLVKYLAVELGPRGILTNAIAPGFFKTELAEDLIEKYGGEEKLGKGTPNGRLGKNEDFAGTVVYLSSRAGSHVNGITITLDGGRNCGPVQRP